MQHNTVQYYSINGTYTIISVIELYQQHRLTVSKYWREHNKQTAADVQDPHLHNKRKGNSGREGIDITPLVELL